MNNAALTRERACILLVDDDHNVRASMRRVLVKAGHDVTEAGSGNAAIALIERAASFDMLVTDVRMPGSCDGVALASWWRETVPGRPVLFVSGHSEGRLDMGGLGPHEAMLHKPFRGASLLDAVQHLTDLMRHRAASVPALAGPSGAAPLVCALQAPWRA